MVLPVGNKLGLAEIVAISDDPSLFGSLLDSTIDQISLDTNANSRSEFVDNISNLPDPTRKSAIIEQLSVWGQVLHQLIDNDDVAQQEVISKQTQDNMASSLTPILTANESTLIGLVATDTFRNIIKTVDQ